MQPLWKTGLKRKHNEKVESHSEIHKTKINRHKPKENQVHKCLTWLHGGEPVSTAHYKLHVLKLGGCCCRKGRSHTRPYYTGALGRRNHSHGSSSARAGTKAQVITSGFGCFILRKTKGNCCKERSNKNGKRMNRCNLQGKAKGNKTVQAKKEKANGRHGNSLPFQNWLL